MSATAIKERPILFSAPMVQAILDGRKTQTRRVVKPQPRPGRLGPNHPTNPSGIIGKSPGQFGDGDYCVWEPPSGPQKGVAIPWSEGCWYRIQPECPYGEPGDWLWVRETFAPRRDVDPIEEPEKARHYALYRANGTSLDEPHWHSYPHRWTPSIHMPRWASRITLEITEVRVERLRSISEADKLAEGATPEVPFGTVWRKLNTKPGIRWEDDPWVWAITFRRIGGGE